MNHMLKVGIILSQEKIPGIHMLLSERVIQVYLLVLAFLFPQKEVDMNSRIPGYFTEYDLFWSLIFFESMKKFHSFLHVN